ncbi:MAG: AlbA family DNA-binding domain-containing protein [Cellulosilyticaceae bacterium]
MDFSKLTHLLEEDEGYKLDFKLKLSLELESEKRELAKDVIAIANAEGGRGYILFGIRDKTKEIVGIETPLEGMEERIQQIIANRSMPPVPISFEWFKIEGKTLGVLTIYKSKQVPHQMTQNGAFYIRRGSTTDVATRHEIARMLQYSGLLQFETVPCRQSTLEDLDSQSMLRLLGCEGSKEVDIHLLLALGVVAEKGQGKGFCPTYGGLLLFGKLPQAFIHQATLELVIEKKSKGITGNIMQMLATFETEVRKVLPPTYPFEALYEIVANAMIHRDYWNTTYHTYVSIESSGIYVENPSCYGYEEGRRRHVRGNSWLYSRLLILKHKEEELHFGIGLEKAKKMFEGGGAMQIVYDEETGVFRVNLPGISKYKEE